MRFEGSAGGLVVWWVRRVGCLSIGIFGWRSKGFRSRDGKLDCWFRWIEKLDDGYNKTNVRSFIVLPNEGLTWENSNEKHRSSSSNNGKPVTHLLGSPMELHLRVLSTSSDDPAEKKNAQTGELSHPQFLWMNGFV